MDEMRIESAIMRQIVSKFIKKAIKKKTGVNVNLDIRNLTVTTRGGSLYFDINAGGSIPIEDVSKLA